MKRDDLVAYLDDYLQVKTIEDSSNNGLQVEGTEEVAELALAVDASLASFEAAQSLGAQMLIVHHGLFWGKPIMVTGPHYRRLMRLFTAGLSLYAAHLPLDLHPDVGNNAALARGLDLSDIAPFGEYKGRPVGFTGQTSAPLALERFVAGVQEVLRGPVVGVWPFGPTTVQQIGIVSGGAAFLLDQAAQAGVDTFLTGEMSHSAYHQARELGLNVVYGGHYATETVGLKALGEHLTSRFGLNASFLELPTGA